jgi:endonuclease III related protein
VKAKLKTIYKRLSYHFGPQHWWPAETPFEVMAGAILTQNTSWSNVEKAIGNLKKEKALNARKLFALPDRRVSRLIRSAGYYNVKTRRLKSFLGFFLKKYGGDIKRMSLSPLRGLREELLAVNGIGPETADSILLYALEKPVFVIDAYTKRVLVRHSLAKEDSDYHQMQSLFMRNLRKDAALFNEYHALLVRVGKEYCLKNKPRCETCPLK